MIRAGWRVSPCGARPSLTEEPFSTMPEFCDVAVAGPFDIVFTYRVPEGMAPVVGGRVLVPFRQQRVSGIVTERFAKRKKARWKVETLS